jgi:hypothetical protein
MLEACSGRAPNARRRDAMPLGHSSARRGVHDHRYHVGNELMTIIDVPVGSVLAAHMLRTTASPVSRTTKTHQSNHREPTVADTAVPDLETL